MPTEVVLSGVECRLDIDQDPEHWVCTWRGNEVETGDGFIAAVEYPLGNDPEEELTQSLDDLDYFYT